MINIDEANINESNRRGVRAGRGGQGGRGRQGGRGGQGRRGQRGGRVERGQVSVSVECEATNININNSQITQTETTSPVNQNKSNLQPITGRDINDMARDLGPKSVINT